MGNAAKKAKGGEEGKGKRSRLLCLDGGGIKGLVNLSIFVLFSNEKKTKNLKIPTLQINVHFCLYRQLNRMYLHIKCSQNDLKPYSIHIVALVHAQIIFYATI
jgi:hypothetical protein